MESHVPSSEEYRFCFEGSLITIIRLDFINFDLAFIFLVTSSATSSARLKFSCLQG